MSEAPDRAIEEAGSDIGASVAYIRQMSTQSAGDNEPWQLYDELTRSSISSRTLDYLEETVLRCAERYPTTPSDRLNAQIEPQIARIGDALSNTQGIGARRRLVRLLGYLGGLKAQLAFDHSDPRTHGWFEVAMQAARECADFDLASWVLANRAITTHHESQVSPDATLKLIEEADEYAHRHSNSRRRAWTSALRARSEAIAGNRLASMTLLDQAANTLASAHEAKGGLDFFDAARLDGVRGTTLLLLHELGEADLALTSALGRGSRSTDDD